MDGEVIALIKPQFEAGREYVGKKGIVRDKNVHIEVIKKVLKFAVEDSFYCHGLTFSPITGGEGNIEFLAYFKLEENKNINIDIKEVVEQAHFNFERK